jgi:hypothetical protein
MTLYIETPTHLREEDISTAALLTAAGFGRVADQENLTDTRNHLLGVDYIQLAREEAGDMVGFAAYRHLWQGCR